MNCEGDLCNEELPKPPSDPLSCHVCFSSRYFGEIVDEGPFDCSRLDNSTVQECGYMENKCSVLQYTDTKDPGFKMYKKSCAKDTTDGCKLYNYTKM